MSTEVTKTLVEFVQQRDEICPGNFGMHGLIEELEFVLKQLKSLGRFLSVRNIQDISQVTIRRSKGIFHFYKMLRVV